MGFQSSQPWTHIRQLSIQVQSSDFAIHLSNLHFVRTKVTEKYCKDKKYVHLKSVSAISFIEKKPSRLEMCKKSSKYLDGNFVCYLSKNGFLGQVSLSSWLTRPKPCSRTSTIQTIWRFWDCGQRSTKLWWPRKKTTYSLWSKKQPTYSCRTRTIIWMSIYVFKGLFRPNRLCSPSHKTKAEPD